MFTNEINFITYEINVFTNGKYFVKIEFYLSIFKLILSCVKKFVVNNEIIIFRSETAFFTNETNLVTCTLINYKRIIPTYVPCCCCWVASR